MATVSALADLVPAVRARADIEDKAMKYLSDNLVRLRGPVNQQTDAAISTGTCTARLFHDAKDTYLTAAVNTGVSVWPVEEPGLFTVNQDVAMLQREDGSYHDGGLVTAVDVSAGTITVTNALTTANALINARVMAKLGADVAMAAYGSPVVGTYDWGFRGTVESDHAGLKPGLPVRIEITLDNSGLVLTEVLNTIVVAGV